jgi:hypothetical protein
MEKKDLLDRAMGFAKKGNGRRLLNTLNKKDIALTVSELDEILKTYCEIGLPGQLETLKKRRGILRGDQYNILAEKVKSSCCSQKFDDFALALGTLLSSGMTMNPTKMDD